MGIEQVPCNFDLFSINSITIMMIKWFRQKEMVIFNFSERIPLWIYVVMNLYIVWKKNCFLAGSFWWSYRNCPKTNRGRSEGRCGRFLQRYENSEHYCHWKPTLIIMFVEMFARFSLMWIFLASIQILVLSWSYLFQGSGKAWLAW